FERASLARSKFEDFRAERAIFEFADLREAVMKDSRFAHANFVGVDLSGARASACDFRDADLYWAFIESFVHAACILHGARFPETVEIAYGPKGVKPPEVERLPLYRTFATVSERQALLRAVPDPGPLPGEGPPKPRAKGAGPKA